MQMLIIARHGIYGYDDRLDDRGRRQMRSLAEKLQPMLNGGCVGILASTAARATESAEIIGETFGVQPEVHDVLFSEAGHREDLPKALELVRSKKGVVDALILVTHYEYVELFPRYFAQEEFGNINFPRRAIEKGEAWLIDCVAKTCAHIA